MINYNKMSQHRIGCLPDATFKSGEPRMLEAMEEAARRKKARPLLTLGYCCLSVYIYTYTVCV